MKTETKIISFRERQRLCHNCSWYKGDFCMCPDGWTLDIKGQCSDFKRKKQEADHED